MKLYTGIDLHSNNSYLAILDEDVKRLMGQDEYNKVGFTSRITSAIASTLQFSGNWTQHYVGRLSDLIDNT